MMTGKSSALAIATGIIFSLPTQAQEAPNILLIIGDDMGVETLAAYGVGENPPVTATLDEMAREGVLFRNFWSQASCSPTRATMMTGRYGFRTGVGAALAGAEGSWTIPDKPEWVAAYEPARATVRLQGRGRGQGGRGEGGRGEGRAAPLPAHGLLSTEFTLPEALKANGQLGYSSAAIGKWHLAGQDNGWLNHPNLAGFDYFSGVFSGRLASFYSWNKVLDGTRTEGGVGYSPSDKAEDAIEWIDAQGEAPWLLWLAFNLPHIPLHLPPEDLWQTDHSELKDNLPHPDTTGEYFASMIEAMDTLIGRLLASLEPEVRDNTYVIFVGDNGTRGLDVNLPFQPDRAKGTIYEGGINVPLIVTGPGVTNGESSDALVNSTDLFATVLEIAGLDPEDIVPEGVVTDSVSFMPALSDPGRPSDRDWIFADYFGGGFAGVEGADYAMRNHRYKLLRTSGQEEFYDLREDPYEQTDLLANELTMGQQLEYRALAEQIANLRGSE